MSEDIARLSIHVRRIVAGDGSLESENEVYCPPRDRSMPVSVCEACPDYGGSGVDLDAQRNFVLCRRLTVESARSLRAARHAFMRRRCLAEAASPADRTAVSAIMRDDVVCVREDLPLHRLRQALFDRQLLGAPVVNEAGEPIGVVMQRDRLNAPDTARVRDVMTRLTFVVPESAPLSQAAALMSCEKLYEVPVISDDGKVVGMVSSLDIMNWLARLNGYLTP